MKCELNKNIELTEDGDNIPSDIYLIENEHQLQVELNESNRYVNFIFSSRLAMYEFGKCKAAAAFARISSSFCTAAA